MTMKHIASDNSTSTLTNIDESSVQPNAVDLKLDKIFLIRPGTFTITEEEKTHRGSVELQPDPSGYFVLQPGTYEVVMENQVEVGAGEAGWVITRSTLNRNGVFLTSGLYDTGYNGVMAAAMHVSIAPMRIKRGTRIGQYISFEAEALSSYNGSYGAGTEDDERYNTQVNIPQVNIDDTDVVSETKRGRGRPKKETAK